MSGYIDVENSFGDNNITTENVEAFFRKCIEMSAVPEEDIEKAMDSFKIKADWYKYYNNKIALPCMLMPNYFIASELEKLYNQITGRDWLIADDINDDSGNISEEKLEQLIAEIIDIYRFVKEARCYNGGPKTRSKHYEDEFYRCFLYCTFIGAFKVKKTRFVPVKTYADVIKIAQNSAAYISKKQVLEAECATALFDAVLINGCQGFFEIMARSYAAIVNKDIILRYNEADWSIVPDCLITQQKAESGEYVPGNQMATMIEHMKDVQFSAEFSKNDTDRNMDTAVKTADAEKQCWIASLNDTDKYIKNYLRAREIYLEYIEKDPSVIEWLTCDIERMIDLYLAEKGRNYILSERDEAENREKVIDIGYILKQTGRNIDRTRKRGVRKLEH